MTERATQLADACDETTRRLTSHELTLSPDRRWLLASDTSGDGRLWSVGALPPRLVMRLSIDGSWAFSPSGFLLGVESKTGGKAIVVHPTRGEVGRFDDVESASEVDGQLLLTGTSSIRLVDVATMATRLTIPTAQRIAPGLAPPATLAGGRSLLVGDTLVSLDGKRVLAQDLRVGGVSTDGGKLVACTSDDRMVVLDTVTGDVLTSHPNGGTGLCGFSRPTLSPDGARAFFVDRGDEPNGSASMVVVVLDIAKGVLTRVRDDRRSFSTALDVSASTTTGPKPRLCISYGNLHWRQQQCPWLLDPTLGVRASAEPPRRSLPITGVEVARAASPDGRLLAAATVTSTSRREDEASYADLKLWTIDARTRRPARPLLLVEGRVFVVEPAPSLRFVSPTRVLFLPGSDSTTSPVLADLATGAKRALTSDLVVLGGSLAAVEGKVLDLASDAEGSLMPTPADWASAPMVFGGCK